MLHIKIKQNKIKTILLALFFLLAPFTPITALKAAAQVAPIGSATVTAQGGFSLNPGDVLTLTAQIIGCSSNLPLYNKIPVSITPNQTPQSPFTADSSQVVSFVLPGNDVLLCGGQNYTMYAVTWKVNGSPVAPTKTYRFADNTAQNLNTLTPIGFVPPVITNTAGINCPSGSVLTGFDVNYQPHCGPVVTTPMPVASAAGQILTSVLPGANYLTQPAVFYSQSGDTVASIEAECVGGCTYVVTRPQVITLAASHTLSSAVHLDFQQGGLWTVNGAFTMTIPVQVSGTINQHFAGSSTVKFGSSQALVPVEWFGAVAGDGTDDTTAIQLALNSLTAGQIQLQIGTYRTSSALSITRSAIGIHGNGMRVTNNTLYVNPNASILLSTSASADVVDVAGTGGSNFVGFGKFEDFNVERSVLPTGTAAGISLNFTYGVMVARVGCEDSSRCLYVHGTGAQGNGHIENFVAEFGYNGVTETSGSFYGIYVDSADGVASPSFRVRNSAVFTALPTGALTTYGAAFIGTALNDQMFDGFETAGVSYGEFVNQTGVSTIITSSDVHFKGSINDGCGISCFLIQGLTTSAGAGVEINGGYLTNAGNTSLIDIESSSGVRISAIQFGVAAGGVNSCVVMQNSSHVSITGTLCNGVTNVGFLLNNTVSSTITGNVLQGAGSANGLILLQNNSDLNVVANNALSGTGNSISVDATSNANTGLDSNTIQAPLAAASVAGQNNLLIPKFTLLGTPALAPVVVTYQCTFAAGTCSIGQTAFTVNTVCTITEVNGGSGAGTAEPQIWISGLTTTNITLSASSTSYAGQAHVVCVGH